MSEKSLGIAMIVRNEAKVIERCLASVVNQIDHWVIVDTGSTDGTQKIIRNILREIPGVLYDREWIDFGHNRTELLKLARGSADYLLLLDADMTAEFENFEINSLVHDMYFMQVHGGVTYRMSYLVRGDIPFHYVGKTHEYLSSDQSTTSDLIDSISVHHHADGGSRSDKYQRDLLLLEDAVREDREDRRSMFYLAQTRQGLGDYEGALTAFRKRIELGGWEEEIFWSLYQIGMILSSRGDWVQAAQAFLSAWDYRPTRAEPLFRLAAGYRANNHFHTAALYADHAATLALPDDRLFVESWIYDWGVDFERSVAYWWTDRREESKQLTQALLARDDVDESYRNALIENLKLF